MIVPIRPTATAKTNAITGNNMVDITIVIPLYFYSKIIFKRLAYSASCSVPRNITVPIRPTTTAKVKATTGNNTTDIFFTPKLA